MGKKIIFSEEQIKDIKERYLNGESCVNIGKVYNVSNKTIRRILDNENVQSRGNRKHDYDEHIFDTIDSAEKAYWIGFIAADGYVNEQRSFMRIKLQECDLGHLQKFIKFIGGDEGMIKHEYHNLTGNKLYYAEVNGKYFVNSLVKLNLRQGKSSGKEQLSPIPKKYIRDYIRGLWDGDGHIEETKLDLISSVEILEFVQNYLHETCDTNIGKITNHCNTYRIFICQNRDKVLKHLYYDGCIALDRKYNTSINLINIRKLKKQLKEAHTNLLKNIGRLK